MKKVLWLSITAVITAFCLWAYGLWRMDIETLTTCSVSESNIFWAYPQPLCTSYLVRFRGTKEDIGTLASGGGLDPVLNGDSGDKYKIAEYLLSKGLSVDSKNYYGYKPEEATTPLQSAVYYNDPERIEFLLQHGASKDVKDKNGRTPLEVAKELQQRKPAIDRQRVISLLENK
ncbi:hypothetical protein WH50_19165 [Pokkaliibacter plantistimulans]|uniref:Ankyrin n=1 Tax=Pokkaliibacter plantistimulans TaxID=1635171 RepID=A0ABX5LW92_9GAMM|nr:ankyrin repeat domain-containing protein [Pokkaliibacter plantistimulans]PXF29768.1 hypothetical protein WH50_19165 [Pokkaliibacter plantistimulans]